MKTVKTGYGFEVRWTLQLIDSLTGAIKQEIVEDKNLVVNSGLTWRTDNEDKFSDVANSTFAFPYIAVGTSATAAQAGDEALVAEYSYDAGPPISYGRIHHGVSHVGALADLSTYEPNTDDPNAPYVIIGCEFDLNDAVGDIKECGLFNDDTTGIMFCREVLPSTITKSATDYLRVYAKVTVMRVVADADTYWEDGIDAYTVRGIITNDGLKTCLDSEHWNDYMMAESGPVDFGDNDPDSPGTPTDPLATDTGLNGTSLRFAVTGEWQAAASYERTCKCICDFDIGGSLPPSALNTIKEAVPLGTTATPTCQWRMTFDGDDDGIVKLDTNCLFFDVIYTVAAI